MEILLIFITPLYSRYSVSDKKKNKVSAYPPLGILYIGAALENNGHKVTVLDYYSDYHFLSFIDGFSIDIGSCHKVS